MISSINDITFSSLSQAPTQVQPGRGHGAPEVADGDFVGRDVFEQGQRWRNRGTAGYAAGVRNEEAVAREQAVAEPTEPSGETGRGLSSDRQEKSGTPSKEAGNDPVGERGVGDEPLDVSENNYLQKLRQIDTAVRAHERAHLGAAGGLAVSGASFQYKQGPDGNKYAVAGEVGIDVSRESTPQATIAKMQKVKAAALAPASPSSQDRRVAANAANSMMQARTDLRVLERTQTEAEAEAAAAQKADRAEAEQAEGEGAGAAAYGVNAAGASQESSGTKLDVMV